MRSNEVSLSEARYLFINIIQDVEKNNPITYICDIEKDDDLCAHTAENRAKPSVTDA